MKRYVIVACLGFFYFTSVLAQQSLEEIFRSSNNYEEIVQQAEEHFRKKHPNILFKNLTQGEHRDGKFVKFMRWKSYWKNSLNPDGTLGDPTAYWRTKQKTGD